MRKLYLIITSIILPILLTDCDRESAPAELSGFSEGEYHGSFELRFESPLSPSYEILKKGGIEFLFNQSNFYYEGVIEYSNDDIYPFGIGSRGSYDFVNDTIYFKERYIPQDSITAQMLNLLPFFTCEYVGNVMYLTKHSENEKLTIILRKR